MQNIPTACTHKSPGLRGTSYPGKSPAINPPILKGLNRFLQEAGTNCITLLHGPRSRGEKTPAIDLSDGCGKYLKTLTDGNNHVTTWNYDPEGRLSSKTDAASASYNYSYYPNGWLSNRVDSLSRSTLYDYDGVGNLTRVRYVSQGATNTFAYDPEDRLQSMSDAVGTSAFSYVWCGEFSQRSSETAPWTGVFSVVSFYSGGTRLQSGYILFSPSSGRMDVVYDTVSANRYTSVLFEQNLASLGTFYYGYLGAGRQLQTVTLPNGSIITNSFDGAARLTETRLRSSSGTTLNLHQYGYNAAHQRTALTNVAGNFWNFSYDTVGQLKSALGKESNGTNRLQEQLTYQYDPAGNLNVRSNKDLGQTFVVNVLNELSNVTRTGTVTVAGATTSTNVSSVTVNGLGASLYADATFARAGFDPTNTIYAAVASDPLGRTDTNTITANYPSPVSFTYDANGNLTSDGARTFVYDQENQLTSVTITNSAAGTSAKTDFVYDGLNRLRIKREWTWRSGSWGQTDEARYVYDGRRMVQELNQFNVPRVTYVRGVDLSGTLEGAGGIGGLLARVDHVNGTVAYYHGDGGGNVTMLLNQQQLPVAKYSYDPYGNTLGQSGPLADANSFRFSSKEYQQNAGLYYYGYRFYDANLQRWLNRDPIGEWGGWNLYTFVRNQSTTLVDRDGLDVYDLRRSAHSCGGLFDHSFVFIDGTGERDAKGRPVNYVVDLNDKGHKGVSP